MKDMMIDLEALGKQTNGVVLQLGAVYFDRKTGEMGPDFSYNIRIDDCRAKGLEVDGDTIRWWLNQSKEAREAVFKNARDLGWVLAKFREFYTKETKVWCHTSFDICHLLSAYEAIGEKPPFAWWDSRDITTLEDLSPVESVEIEETGVKHNAIDDCKNQIAYVVKHFKKLKASVRDVIKKWKIVLEGGSEFEYLTEKRARDELGRHGPKPKKMYSVVYVYTDGRWIEDEVKIIWEAEK